MRMKTPVNKQQPRPGNKDYNKLEPTRDLTEVEIAELLANFQRTGSVRKSAKKINYDWKMAWAVCMAAADEDPTLLTGCDWLREMGQAYREAAWLLIEAEVALIRKGKMRSAMYSSRIAREDSEKCLKEWAKRKGIKEQPKTLEEIEAKEHEYTDELTRFANAPGAEAGPTGTEAGVFATANVGSDAESEDIGGRES